MGLSHPEQSVRFLTFAHGRSFLITRPNIKLLVLLGETRMGLIYDGEAMYERIYEILKDRIESGVLPAGTKTSIAG